MVASTLARAQRVRATNYALRLRKPSFKKQAPAFERDQRPDFRAVHIGLAALSNMLHAKHDGETCEPESSGPVKWSSIARHRLLLVVIVDHVAQPDAESFRRLSFR